MHRLEQIESFSAFLDFLSNPKEYEQLVKDVRSASKEFKDLVEKKRKIKNIDAWRDTENVRISDANKAVEVREKACLDSALQAVEEKKANTIKLTKDRKALTERSKALDDREKAVSDIEKRVVKVENLKGEYEDKLDNLRAKEEELKTKTAEIAKLAGALK